MLQCAGPGIDLPESVIECRYEVLRKPLGFSIDAARLSDDGDAIHAWVVLDGQVVSVGRAHLISGDGGSQDLPGSGPMLPPFPPLASDEAERFRPEYLCGHRVNGNNAVAPGGASDMMEKKPIKKRDLLK